MTSPAPPAARSRVVRSGADVRSPADGARGGTRLRSVGTVPVCLDCYRARRDHCVFCAAWEVFG